MNSGRFGWSAFWHELRRRKVVRVAIAYAGIGFGLLQAADLVLPSLGLAHWYSHLLIALIVGCPVALVLAWLFEWSNGRLSRTREATAGARPAFAARFAMPLVLLTGVAASAVLGAAALLRPAQILTSPTRLVVLPLNAVESTPEYLSGVGLADLLARALDGGGRLETVPADLVLGLVRQHAGSGSADWPQLVAREAGAGAYLTGSVHVAGGRMRVDVAWHELASGGSERVWRVRAEDDTTALFSVVDRLAADLLSRRFARGASAASVRIAARTTTSLEALKEYLRAEEALREGRFNLALEGFERAIEADTGFALAYYRAAFTAATAFGVGTTQLPARRLGEEALLRRDRLPEHDREIVDALVAWRTGRADEAEAIYRDVLMEHPDDPEALFGLANTLWWYNSERGRPMAESRIYFERVLEQDPEFLCPI
ncbi:MAG TPA: tetratricopeptide repeat protein [Longimicrobiales bacterium]